jgi:hypothetical protein
VITDQFQAYMAYAMTCELGQLGPINGAARAQVVRTALGRQFGGIVPVPAQAEAYMAHALCRGDMVPTRLALMINAFWLIYGSRVRLVPVPFRALINPPSGLQVGHNRHVTLNAAPWPENVAYGLGHVVDHQLEVASSVLDDMAVFWPVLSEDVPINPNVGFPLLTKLAKRLEVGSTITLVTPGPPHNWWVQAMGLTDLFTIFLNRMANLFILHEIDVENNADTTVRVLGIEGRKVM